LIGPPVAVAQGCPAPTAIVPDSLVVGTINGTADEVVPFTTN
jgi:hypothetical protein